MNFKKLTKELYHTYKWPILIGGIILALVFWMIPELLQVAIVWTVAIVALAIIYLGGAFGLGILIKKVEDWNNGR